MTTFVGAAGVQTFRAIALKSGLLMYARSGLRPNRAWSPIAMLRAAGSITGKSYRRGQYEQAAADLDAWLAVHGTSGEGA